MFVTFFKSFLEVYSNAGLTSGLLPAAASGLLSPGPAGVWCCMQGGGMLGGGVVWGFRGLKLRMCWLAGRNLEAMGV